MDRRWGIENWQLGIMSVLAVGEAVLFTTCVSAQNIVRDNTLGPAGALTGPVYQIRQADGITVGNNLFHSFETFKLVVGERARFESAGNIQNILARVTGGLSSSIDGRIETQSRAVNLFLINPSGITFGPNARLNVGGPTRGSFVATTVDAVAWANGSQFSATSPGGPGSLLTIVGDPSGFLASQRIPQPIAIANSILSVPPGQNLLLIGGDVSSNGGRLVAPGGRIELGGLTEAGTVRLDENSPNLRLSFPAAVARSNIALTNGTTVTVFSPFDQSGGSVAINAGSLSLDNSFLTSTAIGNGNAGDISVQADNAVELNHNSNILSNTLGTGKGGSIGITAKSLSLNNESALVAKTAGVGDAGKITIRATDTVAVSGVSSISSASSGGAVLGDAGEIDITTGALSLNQAQLSATTEKQGSGGKINIRARSVSITDSLVQTRTTGAGDAGNLEIQADDSVNVRAVSSFTALTTSTSDIGSAGTLTIRTGQLRVQGGARVSASTVGAGRGGTLNINAPSIELTGISTDGQSPSGLFTETLGAGPAGNLTLTIDQLNIQDGAQISASTSGTGRSGNILIRSADLVTLSNGSISTAVNEKAVVNTAGERLGNIEIQTRTLSLSGDRAAVTASTSGKGDAGNILVQADSVSLRNGASISTAVTQNAVGQGGNINIQTEDISLTEAAQITASTAGQGKAGSITVNANTFDATTGGQLRTSTASGSDAGNIVLNLRDRLTLSGANTGLFANTDPGSSGNGGSIVIDPSNVMIQDGAEIAVNSQGTGRGGDIQLQAGTLTLKNQAQISAETASNQGGNITLQLQNLLLLRDRSLISATAGTAAAGGDGGNISIDAPFIVSVLAENNDIRANAFTGKGGNVTINAQGIFGIQPQRFDTSQSDITASSQFGLSGEVTINILDIDPSRGLVPLPVNLIDPSQLIAQSCSPRGAQAASSFVTTGRGGMPPSPTDPLVNEAVSAGWVTVEEGRGQRAEGRREEVREEDVGTRGSGDAESSIQNSKFKTQNSLQSPTPIIEAQGWVKDANGNVFLVSTSPAAVPHGSAIAPPTCP